MDTLPSGWVLCPDCKVRGFQRGKNRQRCRECSEDRTRKYKAGWAREHPQSHDPERSRQHREARRARLLEAGAAASPSSSISWAAREPPELAWLVRVAVPFDYAMSKNAMWRSVGAGHVVLREESNTARQLLATTLRAALGDQEVVQNRLWLDLLVEKPNHKGDAVNVIDLVSDAVQDATGLDDRWYSIRRLDWAVVKTGPRLFVGIGQEVGAVESQVCSYCGQVLPLDAFGKNRAMKSGHARTCLVCARAADRVRT